tara:strand:+ start:1385 stop:1585 length:201 start_codon:yes stop_codon:yes gene_type:complete
MNKTQETIEYIQILLKARKDIIEDNDPVESKNIDRAFMFLEIIELNGGEWLEEDDKMSKLYIGKQK